MWKLSSNFGTNDLWGFQNMRERERVVKGGSILETNKLELNKERVLTNKYFLEKLGWWNVI